MTIRFAWRAAASMLSVAFCVLVYNVVQAQNLPFYVGTFSFAMFALLAIVGNLGMWMSMRGYGTKGGKPSAKREMASAAVVLAVMLAGTFSVTGMLTDNTEASASQTSSALVYSQQGAQDAVDQS